MKPALTLANTPLDLQIAICIFLHPFDILALRKTCKVLEFATRHRTVWIAALHQVCIDNTLFLPSFPIPDMSDLELERAAMAPRRWIELCGPFHKKHDSNDISEMPHPRTTRMIKTTESYYIFIVPGGRYMVTAGINISVWDLGYVPTADDCKLVASVDLGDYCKLFMVQATPDGKGLVILSSYDSENLSIFEIYPQSEMPLLTQIAHPDWFTSREKPTHLLPDTLIFRAHYRDRIVFRVVNYRSNYSTCFTATCFSPISNRDEVETFATKTTIIVLCKEGILIWAIPPLLPQLSNFYDFYFLDNSYNHIPPLFKIPYPDGSVRGNHEIFHWLIPCSWYFESCESVCFDILYMDSKLQRLKIVIKPDLSDASLHIINTMSGILPDLIESLQEEQWPLEGCRMSDDALVYFWNNHETWGAYAGLMSAPFTNVVTRWTRNGLRLVESLCPASGRFVYCAGDGGGTDCKKLVVADLF